MSTRYMWPKSTRLTVTVNGRTYAASASTPILVDEVDVQALTANGWVDLSDFDQEAIDAFGALLTDILLASNNLSDVASAATARSNLGVSNASQLETNLSLGNSIEHNTSSFATATQGSAADSAANTSNSAYGAANSAWGTANSAYSQANGAAVTANTAALAVTVANVTYNAGNVSWNLAQGHKCVITITENTLFKTPTGIATAGRVVIETTQNTGSNYVVDWESAWFFAGGTKAQITATNGARDQFVFEMNDTNLIHQSTTADAK